MGIPITGGQSAAGPGLLTTAQRQDRNINARQGT